VILFRSENWPIAQLKYHRTPSQLWTADRTRGDSWRASDFSAFRRGPQPRLPPPVPLPSSRTGGQTNVLRPGRRGAKGGSALPGTKRGAIPSTILRASLVSNAIATVALGDLHHRVEPGRDIRWHQLGDLAGISVPLVGRQVFSRHDLPPFHRHPQCPVTYRDGVIAPSCGTKHLRSVSAKQVGGQTSFLLSSADGSWELVGALPRCGMPSLAGLSSHRQPCTRSGHIALPIVRIGALLKVVACPPAPRPTPQSGDNWTWRSTTLTVSLKGITETEAAGIRELHDHPLSRDTRQLTTIRSRHCNVRLPRTIRNSTKKLLQK
jgi:hypothetical protein